METIARNYPPLPARTILWNENRFVLANAVPAVVESQQSRKMKLGPTDAEIIETISGWFKDGKPMASATLQSKIRTKFKCGRNRAYDIINVMIDPDAYGYKRIRSFDGKCYEIYSPGSLLPELPELPVREPGTMGD
jgi:hypothetical protein